MVRTVLTLVGAAVVLGGGHWYVWRRLIGDTTDRRVWRRIGAWVVGLGGVATAAACVGMFSGVAVRVQQPLAWVGFVWAAVFWYLLVGVVVGEVVRPLVMRGLSVRDTGTGMVHPPASHPAESTTLQSGLPVSNDPVLAHSVLSSADDAGTVTIPSLPNTTDPGEHLALRPTDRAVSPVLPTSGRAAEAQPAPGMRVLVGASAAVVETPPAQTPALEASAVEDTGAAFSPITEPVPPAGEHPSPPTPANTEVSRRLLVSRLAASATVVAAAATVGLGAQNVFRGPAVTRVTITVPKLPARAHGFRIAMVSDLHIGPLLGRDFCQRVVDTVNATSPDVIALLGDLADGTVADLALRVAPLAQLRARVGRYFVLGNHEYYSEPEAWVAQVQRLGMRVLRNERVVLSDFDLAGVDDIAGRRVGRGPDVGAALAGHNPGRVCVLLAHRPDVVHEAVAHGVDVQLSGHAHGGQLWPGNLVASLLEPTVAGLAHYGGTQLCVSRGAGAWGPPVRVGAPSDITVVELASGARA